MASCKDSVRCVSFVWLCILFSACLVFTTPGVRAFKFLSLPPNPPFYSGLFGLNIDINCTTDDPSATVTLLHGNSPPLPERPLSPNKLILNQQVFTVLNLVTSDAGVYSCKATDQSGKTIQWPGFVMLLIRSIALPKYLVLKPAKAIIVLQGQRTNVTCESEGASAVTLKWEKEKTGSGSFEPVPKSQVKVVKDTSTNMLRAVLQITNARLSDSGTYKCTVKVQHLSRSRLMTIRVDVPTAPAIEPFHENPVIKEGAEMILECIANGSPKPDVTWYREGKRINKTQCKRYSQNCEGNAYEVYEEGETSPQHTPWTTAILKIRSALYPRDQGEFKCVASNGNPPSPEKTFAVDVQAPPRIFERSNKSIHQHQVEVGKETQLSCSVDKSNPLPTFKWYYQAMNCPASSTNCEPDEGQWNLVSDRLLIPPAAPQANKSIVKIESDQENAFYRCQASNMLGNDSLVIRFARFAQSFPSYFVLKPKKRIKVQQGQEAKVECEAEGVKETKLQWKKQTIMGDVPVPDSMVTYVKDGSKNRVRAILKIPNAQKNIQGWYKCVLMFYGKTNHNLIKIKVYETK